MLFCDACDKGFHMDCLEPSLDDMPTGMTTPAHFPDLVKVSRFTEDADLLMGGGVSKTWDYSKDIYLKRKGLRNGVEIRSLGG